LPPDSADRPEAAWEAARVVLIKLRRWADRPEAAWEAAWVGLDNGGQRSEVRGQRAEFRKQMREVC